MYNVKTSRYGLFVHMYDFKFKRNKEKYYRDGHYTILVLIKILKLTAVLQMLSWGFTTFAILLDSYTYYASKIELSFDSCLFLLFGGPLNVIEILKLEIYKKIPSS